MISCLSSARQVPRSEVLGRSEIRTHAYKLGDIAGQWHGLPKPSLSQTTGTGSIATTCFLLHMITLRQRSSYDHRRHTW